MKVDTFTFTQYAPIPGAASSVSQDAARDEKRGLLFIARLRLEKSSVRVGNRDAKRASGKATAAEIETGERRVIEYLLTLVLGVANESLRER